MIQAHYIKPNHLSRTPQRYIYLDTESRKEVIRGVEWQRWRLGVTAFDGWNDHKREVIPVEWKTHSDPSELWIYIDGQMRRRCRTVLVAHNLAFDLRISRAFYVLPGLGYTVSRLGMHEKGMSITWARSDGATLVCIDSSSWLPMKLEKIGSIIGTEKMPDPHYDDDAGWLQRCITDTEILRNACRQLWEMVSEKDLGNWQRTGAGMAWANWRHQHYTHKVVVHDDPRAREAELSATYTGRCEAWQWGRFTGGPFTEWDLPLAYARIARDVPIPTSLAGHHGKVPERVFLHGSPTERWLIKCRVLTESPTLPTHNGHGFIWPIGEVEGWYWDTEVRLAYANGAGIEVIEAYRYKAAPALKQWGDWIVGVVEGETPGFSPIQRAAIKHWARALIGRFAVKYRTWDYYGEGCNDEVGLMDIIDKDSGETESILLLGNESYKGSDEMYGSDVVPSIQGVVMAESRSRLWQIATIAGLENVLYLDTDSVITNPQGTKRIREHQREDSLYELRVKRTFTTMTILGPRQLSVNGEPRFSGIPADAKPIDAIRLGGSRWESLQGALAGGRADTVVVTPTEFMITGSDLRREHLPDGSTNPRTAGML